MPKVRKWIAENLTRIIPKLQKKNIANAFEVFMNTGRYAHNPYKGSKSIAAHASSRRRSIKPSEQYVIPDQQVRVLKGINSHPVAIKKVYRDSMSVFMKRGKANPSIRQNGLEIVESASEITRLTGLKGMGTGCQKFAKTAPESVLASKANVDTYRMLKVKEAQSFKKVTQEDLDEITVEAFKKVQGHTDEEARTIVKMLKRAPCSHY